MSLCKFSHISAALLFHLASVGVLFCPARADGGEQRTVRPNIVLFLVDDLGYADLSCLGSDIQTPNIDSIAAGGVSCRQAYATAPVCGPSRAAIMTGRYQQRFGFEDNPGPFRRSPDVEVGLDLGERTIAGRLKQLGWPSGFGPVADSIRPAGHSVSETNSKTR